MATRALVLVSLVATAAAAVRLGPDIVDSSETGR
jgi:hypothetical protein